MPLFADTLILPWRSLLQASNGTGGAGKDGGSGGGGQGAPAKAPGPKTVVVANINTDGQPVFCVNITRQFSNQTYAASGKETPKGSSVDVSAALRCVALDGPCHVVLCQLLCCVC